jgi:hypothetical protein
MGMRKLSNWTKNLMRKTVLTEFKNKMALTRAYELKSIWKHSKITLIKPGSREKRSSSRERQLVGFALVKKTVPRIP